MWSKMILLLLLLAFCRADEHNLFSSISDLERLYQKETDFNEKLEVHLAAVDKQLKSLDWFLDTYYKDYNYAEEDAAEYVSHPINTYVMLKRTALHWPQVKRVVFDVKVDEQLEELIQMLDTFPDFKDVEGALHGILTLHDTYNLNLTELAKGKVPVLGSDGVIESGQRLTPEDFDHLGKLAYNSGYLDRACEFMQAGIDLSVEAGEEKKASSYRKALETIKRKHDEVLMKKGPRGDTWRTRSLPFDEKLRAKKQFKGVKSASQEPEPVLMEMIDINTVKRQFNRLCRGERLRSPAMDKDLRCFYLHRGDLHLRLGPHKVEEMSLSPYVAVFREFIYEAECQQIIDYAKDRLEISRHTGKRQSPTVSYKRTSKQTWLSDADTQEGNPSVEAAKRVSRRIGQAVDLNSTALVGGEPFQVANYGIGGKYGQHLDGFEMKTGPEEEENVEGNKVKKFPRGNRIATLMAFVSDVESGGATVFPSAGLTVWPKKGDAVFWYNLHQNERLDLLSRHGGCPVLMGSKWITNKWINHYPQMMDYRCPLDPGSTARFPPLKN